MSDEDENEKLAHDRLADAQETIAKVVARAGIPTIDPLVFIVRGREVQELLLARAARQEKQAAELDAYEAPEAPPLGIMGGGAVAEGRPYPLHHHSFAASSETLRSGAAALRFLASHTEDDRVFRLSLPDVLFLLGSSA